MLLAPLMASSMLPVLRTTLPGLSEAASSSCGRRSSRNWHWRRHPIRFSRFTSLDRRPGVTGHHRYTHPAVELDGSGRLSICTTLSTLGTFTWRWHRTRTRYRTPLDGDGMNNMPLSARRHHTPRDR